MSRARSAAHGMVALSAMRIWGVVVGLISLAALARLLPPDEFGLAAMAMTVVAFITLFRDFGLALVVMQRSSLDAEDQSTLFWLNLLLTVFLTVLVIATSGLLAYFYGQPRLTPLLCGAALSLFISGLTGQHDAQLRREMAFGAVARSDALGLTANLVASVLTAMVRQDAWAIVVGSIAQSVTHSLSIYLAHPWRPQHGLRRDRARAFLRPGMDVTIYSVLTYLSTNVAQIMIGYWRGPGALGLFYRAQQIFMLPYQLILSSVTQVLLVLLSKHQGDTQRYRQIYLGCLQRMSLIFFVLAAALPFVAYDLVLFILGPRWVESGRILAWLAPALAAHGVTGIVAPALIAIERSATLRNWALIDVLARAGGVMLGLPFGLTAAAAGFSIASLGISVPLGVVLLARSRHVGIRDQVGACLPSLAVAVAVAVAAALAHSLVHHMLPGGLATLLPTALFGISAGVALAAMLPATRAFVLHDLGEVLRMTGFARFARHVPPADGEADHHGR
ncbi:lipopolysaccharide biosynthesis protein [Sphingomonas sp. CFBP 13720]|uniref:lipopolysaccharide biosynthesis protein n=1 Tax=Sphingomonas sp. CFBP 13720 TaxID=2775302 RepID=UPI00177C399D|nr:lipopolysaccharide biosynthesis protein [Sphingomonas sp. CFBP 13720]MBD8679943.1 lipopolysaccharide biosynthesis protein [Sphingomonas sp. CFBP 13720]